MSRADVSIVVPVYNTEQYLRQTLNSLICQTLSNIEIIIVNDGSPDNSQAIIDEYVEKYPNIVKAYTKENGGLSSARNFGIEKASGRYLAFVDSDDYVNADMYRRMVKKADAQDAEIVCCPIAYVYDTHVKKIKFKKKEFGYSVRENPYMMYRANSFVWNKIYNLDFWKRNGFEFKNQWFEDSELIYNVMLAANKVECVNKAFYYYRKNNQDSITNNVDDRIFDIFKSTDSIISYYKEHGAFNELYEAVEYICVRHIFGRLPAIRKTDDKKKAKQFIDRMYSYLNKAFPDWRKCAFVQAKPTSAKATKLRKFVYRNKLAMLVYTFGPREAMKNYRKKLEKAQETKKQVDTQDNLPKMLAPNDAKKHKRSNVQAHGVELLREIQKIISKKGILCFADFNTCLGLMREGRLPENALAVHVGAVADVAQKDLIINAMEAHGYKLTKQGYIGDYVAEQSYNKLGVKIVIHFYQVDDMQACTWLFYKQQGYEYENKNIRHAVKITGSAINAVKKKKISDVPILIPKNVKKLLEEKYGSKWSSVNKRWKCWESPAATKLDELGYYLSFDYAKAGSYHHNNTKDFIAKKEAEKTALEAAEADNAAV